MVKYTFQFDRADEARFRDILTRLEPTEYNIIEDISLVDPEQPRYSDKKTIIEMDPEACLTFRMGMKTLSIRRERSEEELAAEKELNDRHTIKVTIKVPPSPMGGV